MTTMVSIKAAEDVTEMNTSIVYNVIRNIALLRKLTSVFCKY